MRFDLMVGATTWAASAQLARDVEAQGFSGMLFTETSQTPWMSIAAAATAAPDAGVHDRHRGRLPPQPDGLRRPGLGAGREHRRPLPPRARQPGPGPRRATLRHRLRPSRAPHEGLRAGGAGLPAGVPGRGAPRPRRAVLQAEPACRRSGRPAATPTATSRSTSRRSAPGCAAWPARSPTASTCTPSTRCAYLQNRLLPAVAEGAARAGPRPRRRRAHRAGLRRARRHPRGAGPAARAGPERRSPSTAPPGTTPSSSTTSASRAPPAG